MSHVFTIARNEWRWAGHNPVGDLSRFAEDSRIRWLTDDERKPLLKQTAKNSTLHTFVLIALSTACRAGEFLKLELRDVDLKAARRLFRDTNKHKARTVWICGDALAVLATHAKVRQFSGSVFVNPGGVRCKRGEGVYDYRVPLNAAVAAAGNNKPAIWHRECRG